MWTADALSSEARAYRKTVWRVVETQWRSETMRLTDTLEEQETLEDLIEESKPLLPATCAGLHYLLATPFRYAPYPHGSRFRRANQRDGAFYASEEVDTALAECVFHLLLFFSEAPELPLPTAPHDRTAFSLPVQTGTAIDLTAPPLSRDATIWQAPDDYSGCQDLADTARAAAIAAIRYRSVRDPAEGCNVAVLTPAAFAASGPDGLETWHLLLRAKSVRAWRDFPTREIAFNRHDFAADPRGLFDRGRHREDAIK